MIARAHVCAHTSLRLKRQFADAPALCLPRACALRKALVSHVLSDMDRALISFQQVLLAVHLKPSGTRTG